MMTLLNAVQPSGHDRPVTHCADPQRSFTRNEKADQIGIGYALGSFVTDLIHAPPCDILVAPGLKAAPAKEALPSD
jgi:hypothetical protein